MSRTPKHIYLDPIDAIWMTVAARIGFEVRRTRSAYASVAGGVISIGERESLDPDDCLAQMILHELCHSMVEGSRGLARSDWGLDNTSAKDEVREHACLRLQALLTLDYGLRQVLAPTTEHRIYYDELPDNPLARTAKPGDDRAIDLALAGLERSAHPPWAPHVRQGLGATARVLTVAQDFGAALPGGRRKPLWELLMQAK